MIVSKYRKKIFNNSSFNYFKEIVDQKIREHTPEIQIIAMNHDKDHSKIIDFTLAKASYFKINTSLLGGRATQRNARIPTGNSLKTFLIFKSQSHLKSESVILYALSNQSLEGC